MKAYNTTYYGKFLELRGPCSTAIVSACEIVGLKTLFALDRDRYFVITGCPIGEIEVDRTTYQGALEELGLQTKGED